MQASDRIGIQVEFKNLVIDVGQRLHITSGFGVLPHLVPGGDIHADTLEFLRSFLIDGLCDPAEDVSPCSVAAEQGHLPGNGRVRRIDTVQVFGKPALFLHRYHQEDISLIHFKIIQLAFPDCRAAQDIDHFLVDIGQPWLLFAGVFHKSAGNGFIQELQITVFFLQVADVRQHGISFIRSVVQPPRSQGIPYADHRAVLLYKTVLPGQGLFSLCQITDQPGIFLPVCRMNQQSVKVTAVMEQFFLRVSQHLTKITAHIGQMHRIIQLIPMKAADLPAEYVLRIVQSVHHNSFRRIRSCRSDL